MIDDSFDLNNSFYLYYILSEDLYLNYFRDLSFNFNKSFNNCWYLDYSLDNILDWNYFLNLSIINNWLFKWDIYNTINFSDLFYLYNLLNDSIYSHNLWDLNYSFYNLFDNLLYFYNLGDNSEHFKYIININNSHDLLSYHTNDSLVHLWNDSCLTLDLLKLFKQSFN